MIIYRVEHREKHCGPYCTGSHLPDFQDVKREMGLAHNGKSSHPTIVEEGLIEWYEDAPNLICGFAKRKQVNAWFKGWMKILIKHGFGVARYECPKSAIRFGECQIVFDKTQAQFLGFSHAKSETGSEVKP